MIAHNRSFTRKRTMGYIFVFSFFSIISSSWSESETRLGPVFTAEPPGVVRYARGTGARISCSARGAPSEPAPTVTWLADDGTPLTDVPGLRRVYTNGTLELVAARGAGGGGGGGGGSGGGGVPARTHYTVRCRARNAHGTLLSRDVHIMAVAEGGWEVRAEGGAAAAGGVGALTCRVTGAPAQTALWYRAGVVVGLDHPSPDGRYLLAGDTLLIRDVSAADAGPYSCVARHELTAATKRSRPALLDVLPVSAAAGAAPRVSAAREVSAAAGATLCLPCVAAQYPPPHYTWYRESDGRLQPVQESGDTWRWAGGAALCISHAARPHSGAWLCKAYNGFGDASAQTRVDVQQDITVTVQPEVIVAEAGSTVRLNCSASPAGATLQWLHEGAALAGAAGAAGAAGGGVLELRAVSRAQRGLYQCVARDGLHSAQAAAELRLGDSPPELQYTFIEQALRAGAAVTLRCAAAASPPPAVRWLLDDQPLDAYVARHRYSIWEETSVTGETVSVLNISAALATDGGRYSCRAANPLGAVSHSARLNIYGPPSVRTLGPVRAVAGDNLTLLCPYAGYPIRSIESVCSSVRWTRRGGSAGVAGAVGAAAGAGVSALEGEGRVSARGAALRLSPALPQDAGHYTCSVSAPPGHAAQPASRDFEIQVRNPPKISPFMFSPELTEGSSVQVLCGVSSGDKPMYFSWLKDGAPLPPNLQIEEKSLNEFSLLMFPELRAAHSGRYTCRVTNHAAAANFSATLSVKVAPSWASEPRDVAARLGAPLLAECAARGQPPPRLLWYRRIGGASLESSERWEPTGPAWDGVDPAAARAGGAARRATLSARAASRSHQGLYRCTADNGVGPPLVKQINVTVHEPANFGTAHDVVRNVSAVRGRGATLSCLAHGDAPLALHWTRRGARLDLDSYRWTITEVRTAEGVRSSLRLRAAGREDAGEYRCHAANRHGRGDLLLFLHVEEPPEAPRAPQVWGVGGVWARVRWRARRPPGTHFSALCTPLHAPRTPSRAGSLHNLTLDPEDHRADVDGFTILTAKIENLLPAFTYSLRISASNHVGQSPHSEAVLFTTLEEAPTGAPQDARARALNSGEVHVSWSAPVQESWNGELLGYVVTWREVGGGEGGGGAEGSGVARGWSSSELTLGGLRQYRRHALVVRAFNRAGPGPPSAAVHVVTADGVVSEAPAAVNCAAAATRALRVRWAPPPGVAHPALSYDILYAPMYFSESTSGAVRTAPAGGGGGAGGAGGEEVVSGLRAATNYSVNVRARADTGPGPLSSTVYCVTKEDVPGAVEQVRAVAASAQAVRVTWAAPRPELRAGRLTHYTLYSRELGKVGGEWSQRVEVAGGAGGVGGAGGAGGAGEPWREEEQSHEVRGLRERAVYEFWVRASTAAGAGAASRAVTAAPAALVSARISSVGRTVRAPRGARVRLACSALGAPPLLRHWTPLPPHHTVTDTGDLIIHKLDEKWSRNFTCSVRNGAGGDTLQHAVQVVRAPAAPAPRLVRADRHRLRLAWEPPAAGGAALLGYTLAWRAGWAAGGGGGERELVVPAAEGGATLRGLACGAPYTVVMRAHNAIGSSPLSLALQLRTKGDKAKAPSGKESIWSNSSALRVSLLAWGGRCPTAGWRAAYRPAAPRPAAWTDLHTDGEVLHVTNLESATWYEIRILAQSPAGDTAALYRAATRTHTGEKIGEPIDLPLEPRLSAAEGAAAGGAGSWGRAGALGALGGAALALLLAAALLLACARRERRRSPPPRYSPQPTHHNGKTLDLPDSDPNEISPYATFCMSSGACESAPTVGGVGGAGAAGGGGGAAGAAGAARSCALHLRSFAREPLELAAPPPRPHLLAHPNDYGSARDTDSESSGSPCAACAAELYRLPAAHLSDTLPAGAGGSSTEDGSYGSRRARETQQRPRARRRDHARAAQQPTIRYTPPPPQPGAPRDAL